MRFCFGINALLDWTPKPMKRRSQVFIPRNITFFAAKNEGDVGSYGRKQSNAVMHWRSMQRRLSKNFKIVRQAGEDMRRYGWQWAPGRGALWLLMKSNENSPINGQKYMGFTDGLTDTLVELWDPYSWLLGAHLVGVQIHGFPESYRSYEFEQRALVSTWTSLGIYESRFMVTV